MKETIKKGVGTLLAIAVVALIGVGQVQAQQDFSTDAATVTADIEVIERIAISTIDGNVNFGQVIPGNTGVTPESDAAFEVSGAQGASVEMSWNDSPIFQSSEDTNFPWSPNISVSNAQNGNGQGKTGGTASFIFGSGNVNLDVSGEVDVPSDVDDASYTSEFNLTVTYTSI